MAEPRETSFPSLFERSRAGRRAARPPRHDGPDLGRLLGEEQLRDAPPRLPEVSELDLVRHFTQLAHRQFSIDGNVYPLGSCTMKYNPKVHEEAARLFQDLHPYQAPETAQGTLQLLFELQRDLAALTGMEAVSLQPAAGAHGELTGILLVRAYLEAQGNPRKTVLIPDSAHGTNPASVTTSGYQVRNLKSDAHGCIDLGELDRAMTEEVAGLMLTNPNTLGIFEVRIREICELVHRKGGLVYMDGANMNALVGVARPADFGADVMHLNLHKTFTTPHGGGGPGSGPVAVRKVLEPYLPSPVVVRSQDGTYSLDDDRPKSVGRVRAFYGNFGMAVRALAYIAANGSEGLRQTTQDAVLNANYVMRRLEDLYDLPYNEPCMHECVLSDRRQAGRGVHTIDIAKRLIDYGFHPYTTAFPLIVQGAMMIEPTESASKEELDEFIEAMRAVAEEVEEDPEFVLKAPYTTRVSRLDEATAARKPVLRWKE